MKIRACLVFACVLQLVLMHVQAQDNPLSSAHWISQGFSEDSSRAPIIYNTNFKIAKPVASAKLWITAHGLYESSLNGKRVGQDYFTPGWTNYNKRLYYQQYDLKAYLKNGVNVLQVTVGEGWYRGPFGGQMKRDNYGSDGAMICRLVIIYRDGSTSEVVSDSSWESSTGKILHSDIYSGELVDMTRITDQWNGTIVKDYPKNILLPSFSPPVRKHESFIPKAFITTAAGDQVIDFGQNMTGWVRLQVKGKRGDTVIVQHAEVLDEKGNFYTGNLREAMATDMYILSGDGTEILEPHFTWHGFRYIKVKGLDVKRASIRAVALYSDLQPTGSFECSDSLVNKLYQNVTWSLKSNYLDIPTDCPQRSERLGWTADAQVFLRTASYMYNVKGFFAKWYDDLKSEQRSDGSVPNVIPNIYYKTIRPRYTGVAGWGDAATIVPSVLYEVYGDTATLQDSYAVMKHWVDHMSSNAQDDLLAVPGYGDWLAPGDSTSIPFIDQCFWYYSTCKLIDAAKVVGKTKDAEYYGVIAERIQRAFCHQYLSHDGNLKVNTQTAYILALHFGLLPDSLRSSAADRLVKLIRMNDMHLATGFIGTPYLLETLSETGNDSVAYALLLQRSYPSWLYPVLMGATTVWERWDGIRLDSSVQSTSYNHYAYGSVAEWLYAYAAGIRPATAGYRSVVIDPRPGPGLAWVKCSFESPLGKIVSNWKADKGKVKIKVTIPIGVSATVIVPGEGSFEVGPGAHEFEGKYQGADVKVF